MSEISLESRKRLQGLVLLLKEFIGTPIHVFYKGQNQRDLDAINERLLDDDLTSVADLFELANRRGKREKVIEDISFFEDAVATLEGRIEEMLNLENETLQNQQDD